MDTNMHHLLGRIFAEVLSVAAVAGSIFDSTITRAGGFLAILWYVSQLAVFWHERHKRKKEKAEALSHAIDVAKPD